MIATVTIAQEQLPETISTCRFAQRVAMISNQVQELFVAFKCAHANWHLNDLDAHRTCNTDLWCCAREISKKGALMIDQVAEASANLMHGLHDLFTGYAQRGGRPQLTD
jgi:hypothetical protein